MRNCQKILKKISIVKSHALLRIWIRAIPDLFVCARNIVIRNSAWTSMGNVPDVHQSMVVPDVHQSMVYI